MITEIQQALLNDYPTYDKFLKEYKPADLLVVYNEICTIRKSVAKQRLTIEDINNCYADDDSVSVGVNYLERWIEFLNKFSNINKPLTETRAVGYMLYNDYRHFHLSDLKIIFNKIMKAEYGSFYGSVDAQRILVSFQQYNIERETTRRSVENQLNRLVDPQITKYVKELKISIMEELKKTISNEEELLAACHARFFTYNQNVHDKYKELKDIEREKID